MAKLTLTDISTGYLSQATYNANNDATETALENTLSRDGTTPNEMGADLDLNSNKLLNVDDGTDPTDGINLSQLTSATLASVAELSDLSDVDTSGVTNAQILVYNSTSGEWEPATQATDLDSLTDVTLTAPASGEILEYNGSLWVNVAASYQTVETKIKSADQSKTLDTGLADDDDLAGFTLTAGNNYKIEGMLEINSASATPDFKANLNTTATFTAVMAHMLAGGSQSGSAWNGGEQRMYDVIPLTNDLVAGLVAGASEMCWIRAFVEVSVTGTLALQWAQNNSNATAVTVGRGSYMTVTKLN